MIAISENGVDPSTIGHQEGTLNYNSGPKLWSSDKVSRAVQEYDRKHGIPKYMGKSFKIRHIK